MKHIHQSITPTWLGEIELDGRPFNAYSDGTLLPVIAGGSEPSLLTVEQVAEDWQIGRTRAWALVTSGQLRSVKIGRSRRVPREALDEYLAQLAEEDR